MDYRELMQYAPKDYQPTVFKGVYWEALEEIMKKYGKTEKELTEVELAEVKELAEKYSRATEDPLDTYRG